jgi:hypothetical protein
MKLYEISQSYLSALEFFGDVDNDMSLDTALDTFEAIEGDFEQKVISVAAYAKQLDAEADAIKAAMERMEKRRKALENRSGYLKDYTKICMEQIGKTKIKHPWFNLSIQKNPPSLTVYDEAVIPFEYTKEVTTTSVNKIAIKAALLKGEAVAGAKLSNGTRLVIK